MRTQLAVAAALALLAVPAWPQSDMFSGRAFLTVLPAHPEAQDASLTANQLEVKLDGKQANITSLTQLTSANSPLELILLIDGSVRASLYGQASDIIGFAKEIPSNTTMTIAYMENGHAALQGPLSSDAAAVESGQHMTEGGGGGLERQSVLLPFRPCQTLAFDECRRTPRGGDDHRRNRRI